jgi:hypothetical protein
MQADCTRAGVKSLDVLLADESLVLILDDTEHVWKDKHKDHTANLIQVARYHYFGASAKLFHADASSPLEQGRDEPEQGGMLDHAAQLLERIHTRVYGSNSQQQQQKSEPPLPQQQQQQEEEGDEEGVQVRDAVGLDCVRDDVRAGQGRSCCMVSGTGTAYVRSCAEG